MLSIASLAPWCCLCMHYCRVLLWCFMDLLSFPEPMDFQLTTDCYLWRILKNLIDGCSPSYLLPLLHRDGNSYLSPRTIRIEILLSLTSSSFTFLLAEKLLFVCSCYCTALRHTQLFATLLSSATHVHHPCWDLTQTPAMLTATASSKGTTDVN